MDLDNIIIVDIETDSLLDTLTKIHVVSVAFKKECGNWDTFSTNDYSVMRKIFSDETKTIVGHNFICFDIPAIQKVLGIEFKCNVIDTLPLSWALFPSRMIHGLAKWGEDLGVKKPEIEDWENLSYEEYKHRCEEDCKINTNLWFKFKSKLESLYDGDTDTIIRYIKYLNFKMEILREQENNKIKVDVVKMRENIELFEKMKEGKILSIIPEMPKVPVITMKKKPSKPFKSDGSLSKTGEAWFDLLTKVGLPDDYVGEIKVINKYEEPNPNSNQQVKDWLFSLGWKPDTFTESNSVSKQGEKIPQIRIDGMLCKSVLKLKDKSVGIEHLDGLSVLTHRIGCLKSIEKNLVDGEYVIARASGLANTLRFKHSSPIVNLSGVLSSNGTPPEERDIRDGRFIRELFIANEGCVFLGSDLNSLENRVKFHEIKDLDPEYVELMDVEGFDPHLDLALSAGVLTEAQVEAHKNGTENYSEVRSAYKSANYACQYSVGAATLSKAIGKSKKDAQFIIDAYWERNWAIKVFAEAQKVVKYEDESWIINPINNFRYSLRSEKDRFSTLTQGGATYVFDVWVKLLMAEGVKVALNMHDEIGSGCIRKEDVSKVEELCDKKIKMVTKLLKLKSEMGCETKSGECYADVH